jgi:hypothetical protein
LLVPVALALIAAVATVVGGTLDDLRDHSRRRALDSSAFGSRDLTRILTGLGTVHSRPTLEGASAEGASGQQRLGQAFSLDEIPTGELADVLAIDQEWIDRGVPTISLQIDPDDLDELEKHPLARGREWEYPAHFSWVEGGRVRFASRVACRIHGGKSRFSKDNYGYRIYFRRNKGADHLPRELLDTGAAIPARRVVLRKDGGPGIATFRGEVDWYFTDAMSRDIARQIGLEAPHSTPAAVFVNGEFKEVRDVIERIDARFLGAHFGHENFVLVKVKRAGWEPSRQVKVGPPKVYREFREWTREPDLGPLTDVVQYVDVDNLVRWWMLVMMTGAQDFRQGAAILDLSEPDSRWRWVPWDLDASLGIGRLGPLMNDQIRMTFGRRGTSTKDDRTVLIKRLLRTSDEFRTLFSTIFDEIYNHRLTPEFVESLTDEYEAVLERFGLDTRYLAYVRSFLAERPEALREQFRRRLRYGSTFTATVAVPPEARVIIDGFTYRYPYHGRYTEGSKLYLSVPEELPSPFVGWQVGAQLHAQPDLELEVDGPLNVSLILAANSAT